MADEILRLQQIPRDRVFELGKKIDPDARSGWLKIAKAPTPAAEKQLRGFVAANGPRVVVEVAGAVPLSVLDGLDGICFVILGARKSFDGLALPPSVRRLSIRKQAKQVELPALPGLEELELDAPGADGPPLASLRRLAWMRAKDAGFAERHPKLTELALRATTVPKLPKVPSLERLLLYTPTKLASLAGIAGSPKLQFLRINQARGMKRLGDLSALRQLRTVALVGAHSIADLSDLATAPSLELLDVSMTKLGPAPFEPLRGKLKAGSFQLKGPKQGMELLAYLGVPHQRAPYVETLFDSP